MFLTRVGLLLNVVSSRTKAMISLVAATGVVTSVSDAVQPFLLGAAAASLVSGSNATFRIVAAYIILGLVSAVTSAISNYAILRSREWTSFDIAKSTLAALLVADAEIRSAPVSTLVHAYTKGREAAHTLVSDLLASIVPYAVALILSIYLVASRLSGSSAIVLVVVTGIYVALNLTGVGREMRSARKLSAEQKGIFGIITTAHELGEVIRAFGTSASIERRLASASRVMDGHVKTHARMFFKKHITLDLVRWLGLAALIAAFFIEPTTTAAAHQSLQVGALVTLVFAYFQMMAPIVALSRAGERLAQAAAGLEAAFPVLSDSRSRPSSSIVDRRDINQLTISNITSGYGDRQLGRPLSAAWTRGDTVIFFGPSGVGKSTLGKVLAGLMPAFAGQVIADDAYYILPKDMEQLKGSITYVPQSDFIFAASVAENVTLFDTDITEADILRAMEALGIDKVLSARGLTIYDDLKDRGGDWSGGERRRLALARAYVRSASVLILDEPTAGLDALSARAVTKAFRSKMKDGILIFITHDNIAEDSDQLIDLSKVNVAA